MQRSHRSITPARALACCLALAFAWPALALANTARFEIKAEPLAAALKAFAQQAHMQLLYEYAIVRNVRGNSVIGVIEKHVALEDLLRNTGLEAKFSSDDAATIRPIPSTDPGDMGKPSGANRGKIKTRKNASPPDIRTAMSDDGAAVRIDPDVSARQGSGIEQSATLQEVIVTAQKTKQPILDVPMRVSVLSADSLVSLNAPNITDYYSRVPGLSVQTSGEGNTVLSIDGITTGGFSNPTVGVTVNDVPFGGSLQLDFGNSFPNFDPSDWSTIEVLSGPQGTLYGASSLGGLIRFVTANPSSTHMFGRIEGGTSSVQNGAEPGYHFDGFVNIPLADDLAVRLSAYGRQDPGYIDNPALHIRGVNEAQVRGGRLGMLWRPTSLTTIKFDALFQDTHGNGQDVVFQGPSTKGFGDLQQNFIAGCCTDTRKWQFYSLDVNTRLGPFAVASVSGFQVFNSQEGWDLSPLLRSRPLTPTPYPQADSLPVVDFDNLHKFSQELRLAATFLGRIHVLLGGFYTHEKAVFMQNIPVTNTLTGGLLAPSQGFDSIPITYQESAVFSDITYHFTPKMDLTIGGRASHITESQGSLQGGPIFGLPLSPLTIGQTLHENATPVTFLVTPKLRVLPKVMTYIRVASGYGAGGVNPPPIGGVPIPLQYGPDKTLEYQVGIKAKALRNSMSLDADFFHIRWTNIQLFLVTPQGSGYKSNGSGATSQGFDVSIKDRLMAGLTLSGAITYDQAVLTHAFPKASTAIGLPGASMPFAPKWSGHFSFEEYFHMAEFPDATPFIGGEVDYIGSREGEFSSALARQYYGSYTKLNIHAGATTAGWTAEAYADNLTNRRGIISGGVGDSGYGPYGFYVIRPRTVGITVSRNF